MEACDGRMSKIKGTSFGGLSQAVGLDREQRLNCCQTRVGARNRLVFDKKNLKKKQNLGTSPGVGDPIHIA